MQTTALNQQFRSVESDLPIVHSLVSEIKEEDCQRVKLRQFDLLDVNGHKVNKLIYLQTKQILHSAKKDSIPLDLTSTFRGCAEQASLRLANCPAVDSPAEACSPPTEKLGNSLHNYGMAVDFKCIGHPVFGRSPCYHWLKSKAPKFKFKEHKEEPWHWSLTGL